MSTAQRIEPDVLARLRVLLVGGVPCVSRTGQQVEEDVLRVLYGVAGRSGNWGHVGRPGQIGGSGPGSEDKRVDEEGVTHVGKFVELYHGTSAKRAAKIAKQGFRIRAVKQQTMQGDPESSRNYVWFAKREESAQSYSEFHQDPVVVTVRIPEALYKKINPYGRNSGPDSVWPDQEFQLSISTQFHGRER